MANQIEKLNGIEIAKIAKFNGLTDAQIEKINGLEFTGSTDAQLVTIATQDTSGTAIDGGTGFNTDQSWGSSIAFDPDTDQIIVGFADQANSTRPTIRIGTMSGTTITFGDKIEVDNNISGVTTCNVHYDTQNDRLIVVHRDPYSQYGGTHGVFARAYKLHASTLRTVETTGDRVDLITSSTGGGRGIYTEIQDHDGIVDILYEDYNDSQKNKIATVRVTNASTCALTLSSATEFADDDSHEFGIAYSPDVDRNVILYNVGNEIRAKAVEHLSGNPALGSEYTYNLANCNLNASNPHGGYTMIYDTEHNKFHFLYRYEGSTAGNATHDNYYIGNLTCGGSGNLVISFGNTSGTSMNNTVEIDDLIYGSFNSEFYPSGGLIYSHQRQRIIMHGNSANQGTNGNKKFHVIDYNGSAYTKSSSPIDIFTPSGAPVDTGNIRTDDASGTVGNLSLITYHIYDGTNDGKTFIQGIDAGDSAIS